MRLLVVDDDAVFRDELADLLREEGHEVRAAPSVRKGLEALESAEADVVLTDLKMPRQSGMVLLQEVRSKWPRTLVVMITGYATIETAIEAMRLGAFDYLRKPFRIEQLRSTLALVAQQRVFEAPDGSIRDPWREARTLAAGGEFEVLFVGDRVPTNVDHIEFEPLNPDSPSDLAARVESFVQRHEKCAVVLASVDRLVERHRLEDVVALLERIRSTLEGRGPLRVGFDPGRLSATAAVAVGGSVASDETHSLFEAFSNPIRRKVLERLGGGPAAFGDLMAAAGLDDSPKLSFHLRKLVDAGLLAHEAEKYHLTARGRAGLRLLLEATLMPPSSDRRNVAFAGPSAKGDDSPTGDDRASPTSPPP